ncbi:MAG: hypothetical protein RI884_226 [Pseudomonadota bacterium]
MRVLITGATGFIGGAVARALLRQGHELVCAVRDPARLQLGEGTWRAVPMDLALAPAEDAWRPHLDGVEAVVNAVGIIREQPGQTFDALHHRAPAALFRAAAAAGVRTMVQVSALGADDGAQSRYHRTKKAADDALRALPVAGAVLQPSIVYGDSPGAAMFNLMATSPVLAMPQAGGMQVQPVHVDDVVDGVLAVLRAAPSPVATIACVGPQPMSMAQYLRGLRAALGLPGAWPWVLPLPTALFMLTARIASLIPGSILDAETAGMLLRGNAAPAAEFTRLLGHPPRGVERFIAPADLSAVRARLWRDLAGLVLKGGAAVLVALGLVLLAWSLAR